MITIETLNKLIDHYEEITKLGKDFSYKSLSLFCSFYEEDKDTLHFIGEYVLDWALATPANENIEKKLSDILGMPVNFIDAGAAALKPNDYEEAKKAPLENMNKVIDYFIDTLIPYSTDAEPIEAQRKDANERWKQKKLAASQEIDRRTKNPLNDEGNNNAFFTPISKRAKTDSPQPGLTSPHDLQHPSRSGTPHLILDVLKKHPALWEQIEKDPEVLATLQQADKILQTHAQGKSLEMK